MRSGSGTGMEYPCCGRRARFADRRERTVVYVKVCEACGRTWSVRRTGRWAGSRAVLEWAAVGADADADAGTGAKRGPNAAELRLMKTWRTQEQLDASIAHFDVVLERRGLGHLVAEADRLLGTGTAQGGAA